jgi:hypothetical protein
MKKLIALPFILFILNYNAQKDGDIYNIISFVSDNIELIKNINPEKVRDRTKFNYLLRTHISRNSLNKELKLKMSNNQNYVKFKNRKKIYFGALLSGVVSFATVNLILDPLAASIISILFIMPITAVLAAIPIIGMEKIRVQLLKDYFLSISSANTN